MVKIIGIIFILTGVCQLGSSTIIGLIMIIAGFYLLKM